MKARYIISMVLMGVLFFGGSFYTHARLFGNHSDEAFDENDPTDGAATSSADSGTIRELIIIGAGYFFKAQGDINLLSEKVELSDLGGGDLAALREAVNAALKNMNMARHYYQELEAKANQTPYNQMVLAKLMTFSYDRFQDDHGLLKDVFKEVKGYLSKGDVRGAYSRISAYFDSLIDILVTIKRDVDAGIIPADANMWNLNQVCAKVHMFGQYVCRVFEAQK